MTCQELYDTAIRMVCEDGSEGSTEDYEERAPYLLATLCTECAPLDALWRKGNGDSTAEAPPCAYLELSKPFPLSDPFAPAATYYLAAMLTLEENEDMSDKFFALYTDAISSIRAALPASCGSIVNRYPTL